MMRWRGERADLVRLAGGAGLLGLVDDDGGGAPTPAVCGCCSVREQDVMIIITQKRIKRVKGEKDVEKHIESWDEEERF